MSQDLGNGFSRSFEFALTPAIFAGIGYFLDRALGILPWCTVGLSLFGVVGMFVKVWLDYDAEMKVAVTETIATRNENEERAAASRAQRIAQEQAEEAAA